MVKMIVKAHSAMRRSSPCEVWMRSTLSSTTVSTLAKMSARRVTSKSRPSRVSASKTISCSRARSFSSREMGVPDKRRESINSRERAAAHRGCDRSGVRADRRRTRRRVVWAAPQRLEHDGVELGGGLGIRRAHVIHELVRVAAEEFLDEAALVDVLHDG